ncbi:MAG: hypothetical protein AAF771_08220 [Pseudomonadota bacterium]
MGKVLGHAPTKTVLTRENLERAFGGMRPITGGGDTLCDVEYASEPTIVANDERFSVQ